MSATLEQLELNQTFFVQLAIFAGLFFVLSAVYFKPFLKLFQVRHERTVADKEDAERLMAEAQRKLEEYERRLAEERLSARKEFEELLSRARKEEAEILATAREEGKRITQDAAESVHQQRESLKRQLEADVESIALQISEKLVPRKP